MVTRTIFNHIAGSHILRRTPTFSRRTFASASILRTGDRPTHFTNILAGANTLAVQIKNVGPEGVHLEDGLIIPSACIFIEGKVFLWNVPPTPWEGLKTEHFEFLDIVVPKPG